MIKRHPATPNYLEFPAEGEAVQATFEESANFDPVPGRELLNMAAKAHGGLVYIASVDDWIHEDENGIRGDWWNPLDDDRDALRLATRCYMELCTDGEATVSASHGHGKTMIFITQAVSECGGDRYAAIRRAIVRVAAEIGRLCHD